MNVLSMNVTQVVVLLTEGVDVVQLYTDKPSPYVFESHPQGLILEFKATYDTGVDYVREHFGVEPIVKNLRVN